MKRLVKIFIILLLFPFYGISQNNPTLNTNNEESLFKNQFDLDLYFLGLEGSYKKRISPSLFSGIGIGTTMFRSTISEDFDYWGNFGEIVKLRPFLDFHINDRIHFETGFPFSLAYSSDHNLFGYTFGPEIGVFGEIWKFEIGIRPALLFFTDTSGDFNSPKLTTTLLIMKIPLDRW
jgi:hypothetical protein